MKMTGKSTLFQILLAGYTLLHTTTAATLKPAAVVGPNLCVTLVGSQLLLQTCVGSPFQQWTLFKDDGTNIYRFQNQGSGTCIWTDTITPDEPVVGEILTMGGCTLSNGSGVPPSNAEWSAVNALPGTTLLRTFVRHTVNNLCVDSFNGLLFLNTCSGVITQQWTEG
ncbi:hypothetical protein B0O99DRAFT_45322 [Bisporella sp. PMI_857]|nr:hypothetical protein B0O99DRAFT_45322 [Bisporella sp. PMI_857]